MNSWQLALLALAIGYWTGWLHGSDRATFEARTAYQEAEPVACTPVETPRAAACSAMLDQAYTVLSDEAELMREFYPPLSPHNE